MTYATLTGWVWPAKPENAASVPLPKPQPFGAPVFIGDAVTPLVGETVLSMMMKRMMRDAVDPSKNDCQDGS